VQQLLASKPDTNVAVFVVWLTALGGDSRNFWDPELLSDARAVHLWDADRAIGPWFGARDGSGYSWDVYYLYGPRERLRRSRPVSTGAPVVDSIGKLEAALAASAT
jgi:hypothetical protein